MQTLREAFGYSDSTIYNEKRLLKIRRVHRDVMTTVGDHLLVSETVKPGHKAAYIRTTEHTIIVKTRNKYKLSHYSSFQILNQVHHVCNTASRPFGCGSLPLIFCFSKSCCDKQLQKINKQNQPNKTQENKTKTYTHTKKPQNKSNKTTTTHNKK